MRTKLVFLAIVFAAGWSLFACVEDSNEDIIQGQSIEVDTPQGHSISLSEEFTADLVARPTCTGQITCCSDITCTAVLCTKVDGNCSATCPAGLTKTGGACAFTGVEPLPTN